MIKIKTNNKIVDSNFLKVGETGFYKTENIIIKIGRKEHYLYSVDFYKQWGRGSRIETIVERNISREERRQILMDVLKEYTDKEVKNLDDILWYIEAGEDYHYSQRGSKNFEGIKVN